jgi:8-oxo-dGTP pyrophosphatase MutT (NUDIX family)
VARVETVGGLLVDADGRVLFGLRAPWKKAWPEHWDAPGGHVEPGETVSQAPSAAPAPAPRPAPDRR